VIKINWLATPLVPVIAQDSVTNEILMLAYMNKEAYELTLSTGFAHYFSRSKQRIWKKGESSNHTQIVHDILLDCDGDSVILKITQNGVACHTGRTSCFYTSVTNNKTILEPVVSVDAIYGVVDTLYHTILERKNSNDEKSWTKKLLNDKELLRSKILEEAEELCVAIDEESDEQVIYEATDLLYHSLVGLGSRDISPDRVKQELGRRFGKSGIEEKEGRVKG